jgi:hypothetical protein
VVTAPPKLRRRLVGLPASQAMETLLGLLRRTKTNAALLGPAA